MAVTAKDIAKELNLSQPTVSRILSGDPNHRISEITRTRVMETANRLGYQPNALARSLRRGRTDIIGLYTNHDYDARNDFLGAIIGSLQRSCVGSGLDLLLLNARCGRSPHEVFLRLRDGRIDGLVLHTTVDDPLVGILADSALPVVAVADLLPPLPAVTCDDVGGMRLLIRSLWGRGYRRFAFLRPPLELSSVRRRYETFQNELTAFGLSDADRQIITIDYEDIGNVAERFRYAQTPIAVCCWNDRTAYHLLAACQKEAIDVPGRIAVTGFDGFLDDKLPARRLTTVRCPWESVASAALDMLKEMIDGNVSDGLPSREIQLPVEEIEGDTI